MQRRRFWACLAVFPFLREPAYAGGKPRIVLAALVGKSESFGARWLELIYTDAFNQLGIDLEIRYYPPARASVEAAEGHVDGELVRSFDYLPPKGNLLRVPEPAVFGAVAAYAKQPGIRLLAGWNSLRHTSYRIDYRYGYTGIPRRLAAVLPLMQASVTHNTQTGFRKLLADRSDLYIDYRDIADFTLKSEEFKHSGIYLVANLEQIPFHAFINNKYPLLVKRLSRVLKAMRSTGQIEHYRQQALTEYQ